jgi:hypothetical protein
MTTSTAPPAGQAAPLERPDTVPRAPGTLRRFRTASVVGGVLAMLVFVWLATRGGAAWFDQPRFGDFYDAQARALFDGRWDMPSEVLSFERFNVDGKFYMYFGPTPSVLRMPLLLFTDALDGRLSRLFTVAACALLVFAVARLSWLARRSVRGDAPLSTGEMVVAAAVVLVGSCGTIAPFLAGWTAVYHEAILWGAAFALLSYGALVAWLLDARRRDLVVASGAAALSVLARGSVGVGPIAAIGLVLAARAWAALRDRRADRGVDWGVLLDVGAALAVPVVLYGYVNAAKFGTVLAAPPYEKQDFLLEWPPRIVAMAANDGSLFGWQYAPTILLAYLRPDGVLLDRLFPWVLLKVPTRVVGDAVFEALHPTTSVTAASPLLFVAAVGGMVMATLQRAVRSVWLAPVLGSVIGGAGALSLAFVDHRYQGDFIALLVVPGVLATWKVVDWSKGRSRAVVAVLASVAIVLGAWGLWVSFATAYVFQRAQTVFTTVDDRASLVKTQLDVQDLLGGGLPSRVTAGDTLPRDETRAGTLFVLGDCDGLYRHDGTKWQVVEQTPATGNHRLVVDLDPDARGRQPVLSSDDDLGTTVLWARNRPDDRVGFEYQWEPHDPASTFRSRIPFGSAARRDDGSIAVSAAFDFRDGFSPYLQFRANDDVLFDGVVTDLRGPSVVGAQADLPGEASFAGSIRRTPTPTPLCDELVGTGLRTPPG